MAEHIIHTSKNHPFYQNQVTFQIPVITIRRILGIKGKTFDIKNIQPLENSKDYIAKMQFLSQLGLVNSKTARLKIQESKDIKNLHKNSTDALVKKMLRMKPKYYLENGKVKRIPSISKPKKAMNPRRLVKNVCRKRLSSADSRGVYFSIPKKLNSSKEENRSRLRSHTATKATAGHGLSERSKKLLDLCPELCINAHRMNDSEIARKIRKTDIVGKRLQSTKYCNTAINSKNKLGLSERSQKLLASCGDFSIRVHQMRNNDVARKVRETQNLRKQILHNETRVLNSRISSADKPENNNTTFTSIKSRPCKQEFSIDVHRMTDEEVQNMLKHEKQLVKNMLMGCNYYS